MQFSEYVQKISFRLLQPASPRPSGFRALSSVARKAGIHLDLWMTKLPVDQEMMQDRLRRLCKMRRKSTFAIAAIINRGVEQLPEDQAYVALGVGHGFTMFAGMAAHPRRTCIAVDEFHNRRERREKFLRRFERWKSGSHYFHETNFRDYFQNIHQGEIGLYLIDGERTYQDQWDALAAAEPFLAESGTILIDDANWPQVRKAALDFVSRSDFEYVTILDAQTPRSGHPTFWNGMMILQRGRRRAMSMTIPFPERRAA